MTLLNERYVTKDSGEREEFPTGAKRDVQDDKPRYDLIPVCALKRLAGLYARGAKKYGELNWQQGFPFKRIMASLFRHAFAYMEGDQSEDHAGAVAWNAFALMFYEDQIAKGILSAALDDITQHPVKQHKPELSVEDDHNDRYPS